ncbi:hypothetical protein AB0J86_14605 [Micromonospora sp. NPDC049559]|uniref:hypothetical protein n=1 Tax=Micromonospora sp. NPDC049559 TaxID=3155923 RepID=UPI00343C03F5
MPYLKTLTNRLRHRLNRTFTRGAVLLAAAMVAVLAVPSAAFAEETFYKSCEYDNVACQTGVEVGLPQGQCMGANTAYASTQICVDYYGDYVYVRDGRSDGYAAIGYVGSDEGILTRFCRNNHGYGTWARCNFDWVEATGHAASAGYLEQYYVMELQPLWSWSGK